MFSIFKYQVKEKDKDKKEEKKEEGKLKKTGKEAQRYIDQHRDGALQHAIAMTSDNIRLRLTRDHITQRAQKRILKKKDSDSKEESPPRAFGLPPLSDSPSLQRMKVAVNMWVPQEGEFAVSLYDYEDNQLETEAYPTVPYLTLY